MTSSPLRSRAFRAGGWTLAGYAASQLVRLGGSLVMTRLLVPEMFGVMAIASVVIVMISLLSDVGLTQNIVQSRRGDDPVFLDTAWTVQIVRGLLLWLVALAASAAIYWAGLAGLLAPQSVYASPLLPFVIAANSFAAVIGGFRSTRMITAHRRFDQRRRVEVELAGQLAGLVVMIVFGLLTRSIWALVAGGLTASLVTTVLSHAWMSGHPNRLRLDREALMELIRFGKWIFLSSGVYVLTTNGDRLLLGAVVEPQVLGFYAIAAMMVGAIEGALSSFFVTVSLPALSETARDKPSRLREVYYKLRLPGDLLLLFLAGALFSGGQAVIDLLYDRRYSPAGAMLQVLALSLVSARYGVAHQIYLARGEPRKLAIVNLSRLASLYALVPALYHLAGIHGALWAIALHALATVPLIYAFNARLGLNDLRKELVVLPALPAGFAFGHVLSGILPAG